MVAFSLFINIAMLAPSLYMLQVYDRVISSYSLTTLVMLTLMLLLFMAASGGLEWARAALLHHVAQRFENMLNARLFDMGHRQALYSVGTLAGTQPLQDLKGIRQFMGSNTIFAFVDAPWLPLYLILMYLFHPWMGILGLLSAVALVVLTFFNEKLTRDNQKKSELIFVEAGQTLAQIFRNGEVIRAMGMLGNLRSQWLSKYEHASNLQNQSAGTSQGLSTVSKTLRTALQSIVLGLGAYLVIKEAISPGMMIAGSILLGRALAPIDVLIGSWKQVAIVYEQYQRLNSALEKDSLFETHIALPAPSGVIRVENITVTAPNNPQHVLLRSITMGCPAGSVIGVIGPSGSGKSTFARALLGIWPCAQGAVRLDGVNVFEWNREELGKHIGYLPQDVELFEGTVAENISRFSTINSEEVIKAAKITGIHEMILRLEFGYETRLGSNGANISGGQRQRIGLARAVYGMPKLVVLDEPNSNLDKAGEAALIETIKTLRKNASTVFMITHNLDLLGVTDSTLVITEGSLSLGGPTAKVLSHLAQQTENPQRIGEAATSTNTTTH